MTNEEAVNVLRIMASGIELKGYSDHWVLNFREAYEMAFKSLENERAQGEWIKGREISRTMIGNNIEHIDYKDYTCSNCGLVLDYLLYNCDGSAFYKFCPNCGADMRSDHQTMQ